MKFEKWLLVFNMCVWWFVVLYSAVFAFARATNDERIIILCAIISPLMLVLMMKRYQEYEEEHAEDGA
jgi:hypothetical protein